MICYLDTSALAKKYLQEAGSETLLKILSGARYLMTSFLTELEMLVTLEQAKRQRRLDSPAYREACHAFEEEIRDASIGLIPLDRDLHQAAKRLIRQRRLRAPDAIQLASALSLSVSSKGHCWFLCADRALLDAARLEGLRCHDVSK